MMENCLENLHLTLKMGKLQLYVTIKMAKRMATGKNGFKVFPRAGHLSRQPLLHDFSFNEFDSRAESRRDAGVGSLILGLDFQVEGWGEAFLRPGRRNGKH